VLNGIVRKTPTGYRVQAAWSLSARDDMVQPLPAVEAAKISDVAKLVAREFQAARKQVESVQRCMTLARARNYTAALAEARRAIEAYPQSVLGRVCIANVFDQQKLGPDSPITDKYQNQRVYVHTIGEDPDRDVALFGAGVSPRVKVDPTELVVATWAPGSRYVAALVINGVQRELRIHVAPVASLDGAKTPWTTVTTRDDDVNDFALAGDDLYLMSHKGTPRFKVLRTPLAKPNVATAQVALPAGTAVVTGLVAAGDAIYVRKMNAGMSELWRLPRATGKAEQIALPYSGDIDSMSTDPRRRDIVFDFGGWTRSGAIYAYDPAAHKLVDTKLQPQGPFDAPANLESREVLVKAADGTSVPLSLVYKKGIKLDGSNPTILYGYGSYGISMTPFYRPTWLPWFDRGGVLAVSHVRGGGEYGEDWYKGGYKATKPNTWRDAIACAEWLVANKWTSPAKLSIMGGSAGGIFVGRAITERPDLFGAAVGQVPVSDMMRAESSSRGVRTQPRWSIRSTTSWRRLRGTSGRAGRQWMSYTSGLREARPISRTSRKPAVVRRPTPPSLPSTKRFVT